MILSCFFSDDLKLRAEIHYDKVGYYVRLYEDDVLMDVKKLYGKSIKEVEACCEDFTKRISGPLDICSNVLY